MEQEPSTEFILRIIAHKLSPEEMAEMGDRTLGLWYRSITHALTSPSTGDITQMIKDFFKNHSV